MTLTDIIGYLPYKILGYHKEGHICWIDLEMVARYGISLCNYRPVLRPMSDLATEITEKGYNDGKPFVPITKLVEAATGLQGARVMGAGATIEGESSLWKYKYSLYWNQHRKSFSFFSYVGNEHNVGIEDGIYATWDQAAVFDLLHRWHFERGEAVAIGDLQLDIY